MSRSPESAIRIAVDSANPGQFFACCGLLELADRICNGAEGWFETGRFGVRSPSECSLSEILARFRAAAARATEAAGRDAKETENGDDDEEDDGKAQPLELALAEALGPLRLDWWRDRSLKPWAGSMNVRVIFRAMASAIDPFNADPLNDGHVVFDPDASGRPGKSKPQKGKKREPFYFDARRGGNARAHDIGFMPDALGMTATAFPAVEALCLVGLQRFRPQPTRAPRVFEYHVWSRPLDPIAASVAVCGRLPQAATSIFRFENAFRTDQRKHKAFTPATVVTRSS